jgi:heat shock protein HtpX
MGNSLKTVLLLGALTGLAIFVGDSLGGRSGAVLAFGLMLGINFFSYWYSDKIILKMYRAREISEGELPEIYSIVRDLTERAGLPMPKIYMLPSEAPNAFATGRDPAHAAVAVTNGLLRLLNREEVEGVLAHELAHVANRDTLIGTIAASLAGGIALIARIAGWSMLFAGGRDSEDGNFVGALALMILTPIIAMIIQMAISRSREFAADARGAEFAGSPDGLANALRKLESMSGRTKPLNQTPATSHLFIVNPLSAGGAAKLFSTHPPTEERISRLMSIDPSF